MKTLKTTALAMLSLTALMGASSTAMAIDFTPAGPDDHAPHIQLGIPIQKVAGTHTFSLEISYEDARHRSRKATARCTLATNQSAPKLSCGNLPTINISPDMVTVGSDVVEFSIPILNIAAWEQLTGNVLLGIDIDPNEDVESYFKWVYVEQASSVTYICIATDQDHIECNRECSPASGVAVVILNWHKGMDRAMCTRTCVCSNGVNKPGTPQAPTDAQPWE